MKNNKTIFIIMAFLAGLAIFSVARYMMSIKETYDLKSSLTQIKEQASVLENEKQNLMQELEKEKVIRQQTETDNLNLTQDLNVTREKLAQFDTDLSAACKNIEQLSNRVAFLKAENVALKERNFKLTAADQENENLKAKLNSLAELKKAIKELRSRMRKVKQEVTGITGNDLAVEGNRGYIIKDGKSTYPLRVRIEVTPTQNKE
jgi:chromosome segregation ATPase